MTLYPLVDRILSAIDRTPYPHRSHSLPSSIALKVPSIALPTLIDRTPHPHRSHSLP
ncbi:MAG: hypothetical protein MUF49_07980 [Oculatellaceae cyanobacterium Prado106]|nr:hypothetical protein [Oculatellaceae cyanobacterium Prado106]